MMKATFTLALVGLASALISSCCVPANETVFVTTESGAPLSGAQILPSHISLNCPEPILTGPCGEARLPDDAVYSVHKLGYETVYGLRRSASGPKHVMMNVGWPN